MQPRVNAGYPRELDLAGIEGWEPVRKREVRRIAVTGEGGLEKERRVVFKLKRITGADFLGAKKSAIPATDDRLGIVKRAVGKADAR